MTDDLNAAALGGIYPAEGARNLQFAQMLDQLQVTSEEGGAQKRPEAYEPPVDRTSPAVGASERAMPQKGVRADLTVEPDKTEGLLTAEQIQLLFALQEHQAKSGKVRFACIRTTCFHFPLSLSPSNNATYQYMLVTPCCWRYSLCSLYLQYTHAHMRTLSFFLFRCVLICDLWCVVCGVWHRVLTSPYSGINLFVFQDVDMPGQLGMPLEQIINIVNHYADPRFIVRPALDEDRPPVPELESKSRSTLPEL